MLLKNLKVNKIYLLTGLLILTSMEVSSQVNLQWVRRYDPLLQGGNWTLANYIQTTTDNDGSVYITGPSFTYGTDRSDVITIKYNADGDSVWGTRLNFRWLDTPTAIVVDGNNNVIVAGRSDNWSPVYSVGVLIKYTAGGDTLWTRQYRGSSIGFDQYNTFTDVVLDSLNNIYVTGRCCDSTSNAYGNSKCLTIKFDEAGNQVWLSKIDKGYSYAGYDSGLAIHVEPSGKCCYVAAHTIPGISTIKYDCLTGDTVWTKTELASQWNYCNIATDNSGNILVATSSANNFLLLKYLPGGDLLWSRSYSETLDAYLDYIRDMKIDRDNSIYVTGESNMHSKHDWHRVSNWSTIKYDASGNQVWTRVYSRDNDHGEAPCGLCIDQSGNILVAGFAAEYSPLSYDYVLVKYDHESGATLDTYFYYNLGDHGLYSDYANAMTMDAAGNVFIAGTLNEISTSRFDFGVLKISPDANASTLAFERANLNKAITDHQVTSDTILVNAGLYKSTGYAVSDINIIIDSVYHTNDSDLEFYLIHQSVTDTLIFRTGRDSDNFIGTTLDDSSPLLLTQGTIPLSGTYKPYSSLTGFNNLNPNGEWILRIADKTTGNTGMLYGWKMQLRMGLITGTEPVIPDNSPGSLLRQNYPNPFGQSTVISWQSAVGSRQSAVGNRVVIKVFDFMGKEIRTLVNQDAAPGDHQVVFDATDLPAGVYFYQLRANGRAEIKKMILLK